MTKLEAIKELISDGRRERASTASAKRCVKAAGAMGLDDGKVRNLMAWLDYCDQETGKPYSSKIEKVWP